MSTDTHSLLRNTWILYGIGCCTAVLRLSIKMYLSRHFGLEEWAMCAALALWTSQTVLIQVIVEHGTNQVPDTWRGEMSQEEHNRRVLGAKAFIGAWFVYITAIWLCKWAILQLQTRITERVQQRKAMVYMRYLLLTSYAACILSLFCVCVPFQNNWKIRPDPGSKCTDGLYYLWIVGILNIVTDMCLIILPIPILISLRVSTSRKILLLCLFCLGIFVVVATILRIYFTIAAGDIASMTFWAEIETATLFVVSNAPGIRPIFLRKSADEKQYPPIGSKRDYELSCNYKPTITTHVAAGDSQERIVNEDLENPMVIMQTVGYDVTIETVSNAGDRSSCRESAEDLQVNMDRKI
ncbi:hypothetical protein EDC01DRAFT_732086 [Geopyxis carbonaria]|nr:hypothetical protein EDC01DRAFT_732086 [Geopyxis carbonaria]